MIQIRSGEPGLRLPVEGREARPSHCGGPSGPQLQSRVSQ